MKTSIQQIDPAEKERSKNIGENHFLINKLPKELETE